MKLFFQKYRYLILGFSTVFILGILFFIFKDKIPFLKNEESIIKTEVKILSERVGEHIFLPTDETPTIATVSDPEALRGQTFFLDAKKGDKVLIYTNAKKAILYDPVADKIITIAPLNTGSDTNLEPKEENEKTILNNNQF